MKDELFQLSGRIAALTGAGGVLISEMAGELARRGVKVALLDIVPEAAQKVADTITAEGGQALALRVDVLDRSSLEKAAEAIEAHWGIVDLLVNGAGGNKKEATTSDQLAFFDLPLDALQCVLELNLMGTILPSQILGRRMAKKGTGVIINISSMNAFRPLTRIACYSAAKAAVNNFTQWLAVHLAQNGAPGVRVNAIAPGFFETTQNRFLLRDEKTGELTPRGQQIMAHTPMGRFGVPRDLLGTLIWLASPAAAFVTGAVIPVDGGFAAYSGV